MIEVRPVSDFESAPPPLFNDDAQELEYDTDDETDDDLPELDANSDSENDDESKQAPKNETVRKKWNRQR